MPCVLCHRYIAALPLAICQRCKDERLIRQLEKRAAAVAAEERQCWKPRPQTEQPETD